MQHVHPPPPIQDRVYCPFHDRNQVDIFYDLIDVTRETRFNERHTYPLDPSLDLFIEPEIMEYMYNPYPTLDPNKPALYTCEIRYIVASLINPQVIIISSLEFRLSANNPVQVSELIEHVYDEGFFDSWSRRGITDRNEIKDLFKLWLLIPRSNKNTQQIATIYENLENIYYRRIHFRREQLPIFAYAINPRLHTPNMSPIIADAIQPDFIQLLTEFRAPQYPPPSSYA